MALSVLMTTGSTLLAPLATPALVAALAGSLVKIDGVGLVLSTFQVASRTRARETARSATCRGPASVK